MTDMFNWRPSGTPQGPVTLRTRTAQFGNGYAQSVADGMNNRTQSWSLTFNGNWDEMRPLMDFLDAHAGARSFYFTPPGASEPMRVICNAYTPTPQGGNVVSVSATFNQWFAP